MAKQQNNTVTEHAKKEAEAHYQAGRRLWAEGKRGAAITQYHHAVALDPDSPAAVALTMANSIMDFYDTQQFNP